MRQATHYYTHKAASKPNASKLTCKTTTKTELNCMCRTCCSTRWHTKKVEHYDLWFSFMITLKQCSKEWSRGSSVQHDHLPAQWSRLIVSKTVQLLNLQKACYVPLLMRRPVYNIQLEDVLFTGGLVASISWRLLHISFLSLISDMKSKQVRP